MALWNKYKDKIRAAHQDEPQFGAQSTPLDERTERLILALVFAAKSDGHIDAKERAAIDQQLREAQSKLEVVKQDMARVNVDILGISELKWTGMGEFTVQFSRSVVSDSS